MENNINPSYKSVNEFLDLFQKKYNITILYACETGSRAVGVNVEDSDYDIKGFYVAKEDEYLRVIRSVNPIFNAHHFHLTVEGNEFELDIELRDIQHFFLEKITKNNCRSDFWFQSKIIYRNLFEKEFLIELGPHLQNTIYIFSPNDKSGLETLEKVVKHNGKLLHKKILSLLISCIHFLHSEIFGENKNLVIRFPLYNIFEEIIFLKKECNLNRIQEYLNEDEIILMYKNLDLIEGLYKRKKIDGRTSSTTSIPENLKLFINIINKKFQPEVKRKQLTKTKNELDNKLAQKIFEYYLYKFNNDSNIIKYDYN